MIAARSTDASDASLNLGLFVDRVLQAVRRHEHERASEEDVAALEQAQEFLDSLIQLQHEDGEVVFRQQASPSKLSAYGAAIDSIVFSATKPPDEVFDKLELIRDALDSLLEQQEVTAEEMGEVTGFFQFLSRTTLSRGVESRAKDARGRSPVNRYGAFVG